VNDAEACLARAESNRSFAERLVDDGSHNWAVTAFFYSAVHEINALLLPGGHDVRKGSHIDTEYRLSERHPAISGRYKQLKSMSCRTRYWPDYEADANDTNHARTQLAEISDYCRRIREGKVPGRTS
jgi:uncharacterized protein (UPF0332 family)